MADWLCLEQQAPTHRALMRLKSQAALVSLMQFAVIFA